MSEKFQKSSNSILVCFHVVLDLQLLVADITKPDDSQFNTVPDHIRTSNRHYPYLSNHVGAIDGTHVMTHLP